MNALDKITTDEIWVLSTHPLEFALRQKIASHYKNPIHYLSANQLRRLSLSDLWKTLRNIKSQRLLLLVNTDQQSPTTIWLILLAYCTKTQSIVLLDHQFQEDTPHFFTTIKEILCVLLSSVQGLYSVLKTLILAQYLCHKKPAKIHFSSFKSILYINPNLWLAQKAGGALAHMTGVIQALKNHGYELTYAGIEALKTLPENCLFFQLPGLKYFGIPTETNLLRFSETSTQALSQLLKTQSYDYIYQRSSLNSLTGVLLSRRYRLPLILEYNGSEVWVAQQWGAGLRFPLLARLIERATFRHATWIITISEPLKAELLAKGVEEARIVVHPNGVDPHIFNPARYSRAELLALRKHYNIAETATVLTFIGSFDRWHGVDFLADTIVHFIKEEKTWLDAQQMHFLLIGDGFMMPAVRERLQDTLFQPYITLTGLIEQTQAPLHLAASNFLLSPHLKNEDQSTFFGSPTKLFEYMAMAKPIIAAKLGQIGSVLPKHRYFNEHGGTWVGKPEEAMALLFEPNNAAAFRSAIHYAIDHQANLHSLSTHANAEVLKHYTWDKHVENLLYRVRKA